MRFDRGSASIVCNSNRLDIYVLFTVWDVVIIIGRYDLFNISTR